MWESRLEKSSTQRKAAPLELGAGGGALPVLRERFHKRRTLSQGPFCTKSTRFSTLWTAAPPVPPPRIRIILLSEGCLFTRFPLEQRAPNTTSQH